MYLKCFAAKPIFKQYVKERSWFRVPKPCVFLKRAWFSCRINQLSIALGSKISKFYELSADLFFQT